MSECLSQEELMIVAATLESGVPTTSPDVAPVFQKYEAHLADGCVDCPEAVEALQLVSRAAEVAMNQVLDGIRAPHRSRT